MGDIEQLQRSKRYLSFFSGLLFLHLVAGVTGAENGAIGPVTLDSWDNIGLILAFVIAFYLLRIVNFRAAEGEKYRDSIQYRIDDYAHLFIGANAILNGFVNTLFEWVYDYYGAFLVIFILAVLSFVILAIGMWVFTSIRRHFTGSRRSVDHAISFALRRPPWFLIFANNVGQELNENSNYKRIVFENDGKIGEGSNRNESRWRLVNGFLEILNKDGDIFSRFSYDEGRNMFRATGDSDVKALPKQRIVRDVFEWDEAGRP